jgi:hypothetical protein
VSTPITGDTLMADDDDEPALALALPDVPPEGPIRALGVDDLGDVTQKVVLRP